MKNITKYIMLIEYIMLHKKCPHKRHAIPEVKYLGQWYDDQKKNYTPFLI